MEPKHDMEESRVENADMASTTEYRDQVPDSQLQRTLSSRHLSMIGLGASIGLGLWLGSGQSLTAGGPAAIFLGYTLAGSVVWSVCQSIGEMAVLYPLPAAFVQWTCKFVDPAAGFALGWCYWFHAWITIANELQGIITVLSFWESTAPKVAILLSFWALIILINALAVNMFAEVEVVAAAIKFGWIFVVLISFVVISAGGAPTHETTGFKYWNEEPFTNGFKGFVAVLPTCVFAMASSENTGLVAAESRNPLRSTPKAIGNVWIRLSLFYVLGALAVTITVSPHDPAIFGSSGSGASPFVIAYKQAGLEPLAHMMNAVIFISVLSAGSIAAYAGSRTLVGMSQLGMAPKFMQTADSRGRPWYALGATVLFGGGLSFLNLSQSGATVFGWLSSLASLTTLYSWSMICLSHIRMRAAWKQQARTKADLPWRTWAWPVAAYWGLTCCILIFCVVFYLAVWPLHEEPSAEAFFSRFSSAIGILLVFIGAKCYYGVSSWVDPRTVALDGSRRFYTEEEQESAKSSPWIRRILKNRVKD